MKNLNVFAVVLMFSFATSAMAQSTNTKKSTDGQSTLKIDDAAGKKNKVAGDIDEEIINPKMRAESGSKSKFSMSITPGYTGGSLDAPFDAKRPNLYATSDVETWTTMTGDISVRYRFNKNDSMTLGLGLGLVTPFQGDINPKTSQFQVNNPSLSYTRAFQAGGLQNIFGVSLVGGTNKLARLQDRIGSVTASYTLLKGFKNGLSLGVAVAGSYSAYSTDPGQNANFRKNTGYGGDDRVDSFLGLYPFMEFQFNDRYAFRTVARYTSWYNYYGDANAFSMLPEVGTQSMGIGISLTRDIYLYPNIQFLWQDPRVEKTNVALATTINMF